MTEETEVEGMEAAERGAEETEAAERGTVSVHPPVRVGP